MDGGGYLEIIIANPIAGRGYTRAATARLCETLRARGIEHALWETEYPDHATVLAERALREGASAVWAAGGDATLRETAVGMLDSGLPLGLLPCGTGNDLCRVLGVPARDPIAAYDRQQGGAREIDVWEANGLVFLNVAGIGFDSETLIQARRFRRLPGSMLPYMLGVIVTILTHENLSLHVTIDGEEGDKRLLLFSMANGQYIGGGMRVAPDAITDDGLLDLIMIEPVPRRRIPFILPKFLRGDHVKLPIATVKRAKDVRVRAEKEVVFQIDGELFPTRELHIRRSDRRLLLRGLTEA